MVPFIVLTNFSLERKLLCISGDLQIISAPDRARTGGMVESKMSLTKHL